MTVAELIETLKRLPPQDQAEVETFVRKKARTLRSRSSHSRGRIPTEVLTRIDARREAVFKKHGLAPDVTAFIRDARNRF